MAGISTNRNIRRILVALDTSVRSTAALEAAAELASEFQVQLLGLFVEDINLMHLAGLPFAREFGYFSATERRLAFPDIERLFKVEAAHAQRMLAQTAERMQLQWSFQVVRGQIFSEVFSIAGDADLIVFGKMAGTSTGKKTARTPSGLQQVLILFDDIPASQRALVAAARLAQTTTAPLTVLIIGDTPGSLAHLEQIAVAQLAEIGLEARILHASKADAPHHAQAALTEKMGILVLARQNHALSRELQQLLGKISSPVVIVS